MRLYRVLVCLLGVIGITAISSSGVEYTGTQYYSPSKSGGPNYSSGEQTFVCYAVNTRIMLDCSFISILSKNTGVAAWKPWDGHDYGHIEANRSFGLFYLTLADLANNYTVVNGQTRGI